MKLALLIVAAASLQGHHTTAPYDLVHGTIINGLVTRFDWENPHAHIYLDVTAEDGSIERWSVELESPKILVRLGWTKETIQRGDRISATGGRAKNGSFNLRGAYIQLPDGRRMAALQPPEN